MTSPDEQKCYTSLKQHGSKHTTQTHKNQAYFSSFQANVAAWGMGWTGSK